MIEIKLPKLTMESRQHSHTEHKTNVLHPMNRLQSFNVVDIPNLLMHNTNAEGMSINWLTGWEFATNFCHITHDTVNLLCITKDDGNFISGFNHAIQYSNSMGDSDELFSWKLITPMEPSVDPYNFHKIHQELIHFGEIETYESIDKLIKHIQDSPDIFVSKNKNILSSLILCCSCIKHNGVAFIKIHKFDKPTLDCIVTCCALADCKLVILPWDGYYISLTNINVSLFDNNYLNIIQCLPNNTFLNSSKAIDSLVLTLSTIIHSMDLKKNRWLPIEHIIALPNELSTFSHVY